MKKKILIQILLILLILVIFFIVYQRYFKEIPVSQVSEIEQENKDLKNSLINITYESIDASGRKYVINSEKGTFDNEDPELIYMSNVSARIILSDKSVININSKNAEYNTVNYDTKFKNNVELKFLEHDIFCGNLNIFFKDNLLEAYTNLTYKNLDIVMLADKMEIDLITKNSKIFNLNENKVKIKKRKLNGNN